MFNKFSVYVPMKISSQPTTNADIKVIHLSFWLLFIAVKPKTSERGQVRLIYFFIAIIYRDRFSIAKQLVIRTKRKQ